MQTDNVVLWVTTTAALLGAVFAIIKDWRKPKLDEAQTEAIKSQVQKTNLEVNNARDLRIWDLERWSDKIWPWVRAATDRMNVLCQLVQEDHEALGKTMPPLPMLDEPPPPPPPRDIA